MRQKLMMADEAKTNDGGAVYVDKSCTFTISSSTFEGNNAKNKGAAVYSPDASMKLQSSTFTKNTADDGGAIYTNKIIDYPSNLVFRNNVARNGDGGAIYISGTCYPEFTRCTFEGNRAEKGDGGGVYFKGTIKNSRTKITGCSFIGNYAKKSGGGLYVEEVSYIQNSVFKNNVANENDGGAAYIGHAITQDILGSTFSDNKAGSYGGAIYSKPASLHKIQNCEFNQNTAERGGAIYVGKITDGIYKSNFIKNKASKAGAKDCDGGAVYTAVDFKCEFSIKECRFEGNHANKRGGAVYTDYRFFGGSKLHVAYCTFVDNTADHYGYDGGYAGNSIFNQGDFKELYGVWMGTNNPDFSNQFVEEDDGGRDKVCSPRYYLKLGMDISNNRPVAGNPYTVSLLLYPAVSAGSAVEASNLIIPHAIASFHGSEGFVTSIVNNNETKDYASAVVVFNSGQGKIYGKLNNQELSLNIQTTDKYPCSVNITYCDDAQYPDAMSVGYEIEHMENAIYEIRDSQGVIVKTGSLTDPNTAEIGGLLPGSYSITVISLESYNYLRGSANATFRISKGNIGELRVVVQDQTSTEAIKGLVYSSDDGEYNLTVAGTTTVVTVKDHIGYFKLGALPDGDYEAEISFEDHELYGSFSNSTMFAVSDDVTLFEIDISPGEVEYGQNFVISNRIQEGATGTIDYYLLNGTYIGQANAGENVTLQQFTVGPKIIVAIYSDDANFASMSDIEYLLVNSTVTQFDATIQWLYSGDQWEDYYSTGHDNNGWVYRIPRDFLEGGLRIYPKMADGATGIVTYYRDGTQVAQLAPGQGYSLPENLPIGLYTYTIEYSGDANFESASDKIYVLIVEANAAFHIGIGGGSATMDTQSCQMICGDDNVEIVHLEYGDDPTSVKCTVYIDGVELCKLATDEIFKLPYLDPGRHLVHAYFPGDGPYNPPCYDAFYLDVKTNHTDMELEIDKSVIDYGETSIITHVLPENATGTIDYYVINESSLNESSINEIFLGRVNVGENFTLPILGGGDLIIIAKYSGSRHFMDSTASINLTVNRIEPIFEIHN